MSFSATSRRPPDDLFNSGVAQAIALHAGLAALLIAAAYLHFGHHDR